MKIFLQCEHFDSYQFAFILSPARFSSTRKYIVRPSVRSSIATNFTFNGQLIFLMYSLGFVMLKN